MHIPAMLGVTELIRKSSCVSVSKESAMMSRSGCGYRFSMRVVGKRGRYHLQSEDSAVVFQGTHG